MSAPRLLSNRYELGDTLGYGGMSEVHHGTDIRLGREVAVKILRADLARDPQFQERFRREAQNAAALNHPAIVAVYDTGETQTEFGPLPYIVMEYVKGRTLRDIVKTEGPMSQKRAMEVMADVCAALDFSHRHGIVHRDVKPANVMITDHGAVKVMDFGIARAMHDGQAAMTQTAAVIGTAQYLSPEQARGEGVDARSDVYAAGCVLYELVTGEPPFTGDSPVAVAYQHVREDPKAPSTVNPAVSAELDAIVLKALAKGPANRYQSAAEMRSDMVRVLSGQRPSAPMVMTADERTQVLNGGGPPGHAAEYEEYGEGYAEDDPARRRRRRTWTAVLFTVLGLALVMFFVWLSGAFDTKAATAAVPDVRGQQQAAAEDMLRAKGFTKITPVQVSCKMLQNQQPACGPDDVGKVLSTDPAAGQTVTTTTEIKVSVGAAPKKVQVPNLTGKSEDEAAAALQAVGLYLDPNAPQVDVSDPNQYGKVVRQSIAANSTVDEGTTVTVTVGKTKNMVQVPDETGKQFEDAQSALTAAGFKVSKQSQASAEPEGKVLNQKPNAGLQPEGSTVTLFVSDGSQAQITMPDLTGLTQDQAQAKLQQAGWDGQLNYQADRVNDSDQEGLVTRTSPSAGVQIAKNQSITLFIGETNGNGGGGNNSTSPSAPTSKTGLPGFP
ncbi:serine/threonine-protein kinase [Amycolatopsis bartoniae]|uniref:non-specific serine/threonine protein kinase n=1 Tax=Amycolatopsis bartoniae TaxID=941986 RepID=A0A8H9IWL2_9PSEU|nr:Stk1 family PASTA domain-containing Ser/Thr kinase [Amycolatopsis bartoniae]MBB2933256.1 serine/threonine-protein kinase [Amycolatopsis bartoniae]TVT11759.1 Stk1 family PASTA domain-containing Ser/Thr kinase [Amycolatopsis bartoniae]GHF58201.1 serine/threonine protein kinase [Amycolatopsis bartoniae]